MGLGVWEAQEGFRDAGDVLILCLGAAYTEVDTLSYALMITVHFCIFYFSQKFPLRKKKKKHKTEPECNPVK